MKKLLIYELNELPLSVLNWYMAKNKEGYFAKRLSPEYIYETICSDDGELHPWTTWPTLYRGVNNHKHKIQFINQKTPESYLYPTVWEDLLEKGKTIGIFGSLQSYPPISEKNVCFYLPDSYSLDTKTHPKNLELFQKLNLELVKSNKGQVSKFGYKSCLLLINFLLNYGLNFYQIKIIFLQLIDELINQKNKNKRFLIQPVLSYPLYFKYLKKHKPDFSTFFTNHLAASMHRYWRSAFPNDFKHNNTNHIWPGGKKCIFQAMEIAENQIKQLDSFARRNNYSLWVISSMGQRAIDRGKYIPEIKIENEVDFFKNLFPKEIFKTIEVTPAMFPDICIKLNSKIYKKAILDVVLGITDTKGNNLFILRYESNSQLNFMTVPSENLVNDKTVIYKNKNINMNKLGIKLIERDAGTGYHYEKGVLITNNNKDFSNFRDKIIDTTLIKNYILENF